MWSTRIRILWVGRTRQRFLDEGIRRYIGLIEPLARLSVIEIGEEKGAADPVARMVEGRRILKQSGSFVLLDERGTQFTSRQFASFLQEMGPSDFVLGGPCGVSDEVRLQASSVVALSHMTFQHEMARLVFLEQIYRAITIIRGMHYHH